MEELLAVIVEQINRRPKTEKYFAIYKVIKPAGSVEMDRDHIGVCVCVCVGVSVCVCERVSACVSVCVHVYAECVGSSSRPDNNPLCTFRTKRIPGAADCNSEENLFT